MSSNPLAEAWEVLGRIVPEPLFQELSLCVAQELEEIVRDKLLDDLDELLSLEQLHELREHYRQLAQEKKGPA